MPRPAFQPKVHLAATWPTPGLSAQDGRCGGFFVQALLTDDALKVTCESCLLAMGYDVERHLLVGKRCVYCQGDVVGSNPPTCTRCGRSPA